MYMFSIMDAYDLNAPPESQRANVSRLTFIGETCGYDTITVIAFPV